MNLPRHTTTSERRWTVTKSSTAHYQTGPGKQRSPSPCPKRRTSTTGLTPDDSYEVRVRSYHTNEHPNNTYRWGYATVYNDDCDQMRERDTCSIDVNQTKNGRINYERSPNKDIDGYTVDLVSGRTYVIRVNGKSTSHGTLVDPHLELFRGEDNKVASNDNGGSGLNSKLTYTPASTEDYLIKVSSNVAANGAPTG